MKTNKVSCLILAALACAAARGGQITLTNGDRLTGAVVKSDGKNLVIKADLAGTVTIPWTAVQSISSAEPLALTLKDGGKLVGPVSTTDGRVEVKTENAGLVTTTKDAIAEVRSKDEEAVYEAEQERLRHPHLLDLWSGSVDTGLSAARGNSDTTTFNLGMNAARATTTDKISAYFTSLYADNTTNGIHTTTADAVRGGVGYNFNLTSRVFAFGAVDLEYDKFQMLNLRFVGSGGLGYHVVKTDRTQFDLFGGGALDKAFYTTGLDETFGEAQAGEELTEKLSKITVIHEKFMLFPNLSDTGQLRMNFDASAITNLNKWLAWQISMSDRYVSNPLPGTKTNDLLLTTGLHLTFGKK